MAGQSPVPSDWQAKENKELTVSTRREVRKRSDRLWDAAWRFRSLGSSKCQANWHNQTGGTVEACGDNTENRGGSSRQPAVYRHAFPIPFERENPSACPRPYARLPGLRVNWRGTRRTFFLRAC